MQSVDSAACPPTVAAATTFRPSARQVLWGVRLPRSPACGSAAASKSPRADADGRRDHRPGALRHLPGRARAGVRANGGELRIRAAGFQARKNLEDFDYDQQRSPRGDTIAHLGALDFVAARDNVVFLEPPQQ